MKLKTGHIVAVGAIGIAGIVGYFLFFAKGGSPNVQQGDKPQNIWEQIQEFSLAETVGDTWDSVWGEGGEDIENTITGVAGDIGQQGADIISGWFGK